MKRVLTTVVALTLTAGLTGCCGWPGLCCPSFLAGNCAQAPENCGSCDTGCDTCGGAGCQTCGDANAGLGGLLGVGQGACEGCRGKGCRLCRAEAFTPGPPAAQITYPYYTVRGPRDFLARSPRSIGP